ncbi:MAG TPA: ABC transporter permease [Gemmatimonadaceae bacterium]|nr:ABC transporter permease [Gemmatimonadaceae bacterium]
MSMLAKEIGFAARSLRKNPGFAFTAIVTLALGIGASTAIFSVVNAVLLRPLPYKDPERLAIVWDDLRNRNVTNFPFSGGDFRDLRQQVTLFQAFAGVATGRQAITDEASKPEMVKVAFATTNIFSVLGVNPALGRGFIESDGEPQPVAQAQSAAQPGNAQAPAGGGAGQGGQPQAAPPRVPIIVVLSHGFWQRRYGGDSTIVGKTITMGRNVGQIVGVLEPNVELHFPPKANVERMPDVWSAMRINFDSASRIDHGIRVIGRLKDGATFAAAQAQVDRLAADLRERFPIKNTAGLYMRVEPMKLDVVRTVQRPLTLLLGSVGFVLLIACANVANLLLVRASARERELAVRSALGGSRMILVRQMLTESLVLASISTAVGLILAQFGIDLLAAVAPATLPRLDGVSLDPTVFAFAIGLTLLSIIIFGLVPALRASRPNVADILRGGRAASQFGGAALRASVVVAEVALSIVLLVGSGLMMRSFVAVARTDPGFDARGMLSFTVQNTRIRGAEERDAFVRQFRERLSAIPGVTGVTAAGNLPLDGNDPNGRYVPEEQAGDEKAFRQAQIFFVQPGYFEVMKTRIVAGRALQEQDVPSPPQLPPNATPQQIQAVQAALQQLVIPVVVDEFLVRKVYPNAPAVGKRILARLGGTQMTPFEIVGVARHQRHTSLTADEREAIYFPSSIANGRWAVRSSDDRSATLLPQVRAALASVDPMVPIAEVTPIADFVDKAIAPTRFALIMLGIFAVIAAILASVGLYGVLASAVRQRTAEIGVRMAFGASSRSILVLVVGQGMRLSAAGVVLGLVGALALTGVLRTMLVGVTATDPLTFVLIAMLFALVAVLACWVPARRAAGLDPNVALRDE